MMKAYCFRVTAVERRTGKVPSEFHRPWLHEVWDISRFAAWLNVANEFAREFPAYQFSLESVNHQQSRAA